MDSFEYQLNWADWKPEQLNTTSEQATVDTIIPSHLSAEFAGKFEKAQSAYVKVDVEGMDQKALSGMTELLLQQRGKPGQDKFLVDFMMLEFCAPCMEKVRKTQGMAKYDLKTMVMTLEALGFEAFLMGP